MQKPTKVNSILANAMNVFFGKSTVVTGFQKRHLFFCLFSSVSLQFSCIVGDFTPAAFFLKPYSSVNFRRVISQTVIISDQSTCYAKVIIHPRDRKCTDHIYFFLFWQSKSTSTTATTTTTAVALIKNNGADTKRWKPFIMPFLRQQEK